MLKKRILAIGRSNIDFIMKLARFAEKGETVTSDGTYAFVPGGKGANFAVCASRLGADIVLCSKVGNDSFGSQLVDKFSAERIDVRFIAKDKNAKTSLCVIAAEETGLNRNTVFSGADASLNATDIENAFTCYPDALLLSFENNDENIFFATKLAKEKNVLLFLDTSSITYDFPLEQLGHAEVICVNEKEAIQITGTNPTSSANCLKTCLEIMNRIPCRYVVLKLGERGCFVYDGTHCHHVAPTETEVVDRTGAGDAFTSALVYRYMENGCNIIDACEFANSVCAYVISRPGGLSSFPTSKQIDEFLENTKTNF